MKTLWVIERKQGGGPWEVFDAAVDEVDARLSLGDLLRCAGNTDQYRLVQYQRVSKKRVQSEEVDK